MKQDYSELEKRVAAQLANNDRTPVGDTYYSPTGRFPTQPEMQELPAKCMCSGGVAGQAKAVSEGHTLLQRGEMVATDAQWAAAKARAASDPLTRQVGGSHYADRGIQPVQFGMINRWDPCSFSTLKYLTRYRQKNGKQDLEKARHFVELRTATMTGGIYDPQHITMGEYVVANEIIGLDRVALEHLDDWVTKHNDRSRLNLLVALDLLISEYP